MLGIFKKCLISLSVVSGGFGVNLGSSVIDFSNSTNNVFKTQIKQANDSSSSLYNVGDVINIGSSSFSIIHSYHLTSSNFDNPIIFDCPYIYIYSASIYRGVNEVICSSDGLSFTIRKLNYALSSNESLFTYFNLNGTNGNLIPLSESVSIDGYSSIYSFPSLFKKMDLSSNLKIHFNNYDYSFVDFYLLDDLPFNPVTDSISILVSGLTEFGKGLGQCISDIVTAMMYTGEGVNKVLSPFFVVVLVFASIALCVSLTSFIFNWLRNLGGKQ